MPLSSFLDVLSFSTDNTTCYFQGKLGLKVEENEVDKKMKMIINTTMSPWLR